MLSLWREGCRLNNTTSLSMRWRSTISPYYNGSAYHYEDPLPFTTGHLLSTPWLVFCDPHTSEIYTQIKDNAEGLHIEEGLRNTKWRQREEEGKNIDRTLLLDLSFLLNEVGPRVLLGPIYHQLPQELHVGSSHSLRVRQDLGHVHRNSYLQRRHKQARQSNSSEWVIAKT